MQEKESDLKIDFHAKAREELADAAGWYEEKKSGLGEEIEMDGKTASDF